MARRAAKRKQSNKPRQPSPAEARHHQVVREEALLVRLLAHLSEDDYRRDAIIKCMSCREGVTQGDLDKCCTCNVLLRFL